jgi:acetylglutamate kinase
MVAGALRPQEKAAVLAEALPYIRRFWGRVVVVKYGGNAMEDPALGELFAQDVVLMRSVGMRPVVVHGGGPQIGDLMNRLGKEPEFREGLRVTDAETLDIARMVLVGKVNRDIVSEVNVHGPLAVGLSGEDAGLITASRRSPDLGFVGDVEAVNASILERLLSEELIPIVATIGSDLEGQAYNINADTAAGAIAEAASKLRPDVHRQPQPDLLFLGLSMFLIPLCQDFESTRGEQIAVGETACSPAASL